MMYRAGWVPITTSAPGSTGEVVRSIPWHLARGLASVAAGAGAEIFEASPVVDIEQRGGYWRVRTPTGTIDATTLLCCTNAYNQAIDHVRGSVIPVRTAQLASAPLGEAQWQRILPGGESASDTQRLLTSFRITGDKRLIMGGASATAGDEEPALMDSLHDAARQRFPMLRDIDWQFAWSGYLGLTRDHLPQIFKPAPGFLAPIACNGRGIAMATATGRQLADIVLTGSEKDCDLPLRDLRRRVWFSAARPRDTCRCHDQSVPRSSRPTWTVTRPAAANTAAFPDITIAYYRQARPAAFDKLWLKNNKISVPYWKWALTWAIFVRNTQNLLRASQTQGG